MVKFAARLRDELRREGWEAYYIKYKPLKKLLKKIAAFERTADIVRAVKVRQQFVDQLEQNVQQVQAFFAQPTRALAAQGARVSAALLAALDASIDGDVYNPAALVVQFAEEKEGVKEEGVHSETATAAGAKATGGGKESGSKISADTAAADTEEHSAPTSSDDVEASLPAPETEEEASARRSKEACAAMDGLAAFRREIAAVVTYAAVNCEAVRKIVKKHDKQALDTLLAPRMHAFMLTMSFASARSNDAILTALDCASDLHHRLTMKSKSFARYFDSLLRKSTLAYATDDGGYSSSTSLLNNDAASSHALFVIGGSASTRDGIAGSTANNNDKTKSTYSSTSEPSVRLGASINRKVAGDGTHVCTYCPCGYRLNWSFARPAGYRLIKQREEIRRQDDWCGKYFPRSWPLACRQSTVLGAVLVVISSVIVILALAVQPERTRTLVYLGVIGAVVLSFANGANDICNSMGTSVGAGALTLKQALVLGAIFEFFGAVTMGASVAKTISKGVIDPDAYASDCSGTLLFALGMLCVLAGAGVTTLMATMYGLPISATHSIVGGLVAVGLAAKGASSLGVDAIVKTMLAWVASPMLGALTAAFVHVVISKSIFGAADPERRSHHLRPLFIIVAVSVCACFMLIKGPEAIKIKPIGLAIGVGIGIGVGTALIILLIEEAMRMRSRAKRKRPAAEVAEVATVRSDHDEMSLTMAQVEAGGADAEANAEVIELGCVTRGEGYDDRDGDADGDGEGEGTASMDSDREKSREVAAASRREGAEKPFVPLLILSALVVAFAHGGNDVGNAVGPLAVIVEVVSEGRVAGTPNIPMWALIIGAAGFVVGIALLGSRTVSTVGGKITKLTPSKSFATQMGAAVAVLTSSVLGMPVSTSHCLVGAVVGIGAADRCMRGEGELNVSVLKKIFVGWAVTIPLAMAVSVVVFWITVPVFGSGGGGGGGNSVNVTENVTQGCEANW